MLRDRNGSITVEITRQQLEEWAGRRLTDEQVERLDGCIPNSSIPEAIGVIVAEALNLPPVDEPAYFMTAAELAFMRHPEVAARVDQAISHPETLLKRNIDDLG